MVTNMVNLAKLLRKMDIPTHRKSGFNKNNLLWLSRNLSVKNFDRPKFDEAMAEIRRRLDEKDYSQ